MGESWEISGDPEELCAMMCDNAAPVENIYLGSIPTDKESAISMKELASLWGCTTREVRSIVESLRLQGHLIVTNEHGYFITDDTEDLKEYYAKTRAKAISTLRNAKFVRLRLKEKGAL